MVSGRRVTHLYAADLRIQTMMHSYASAAKLRGSGPILTLGFEAMSHNGSPPPRIVIGNPFRDAAPKALCLLLLYWFCYSCGRA
jgi:hypothetical protein